MIIIELILFGDVFQQHKAEEKDTGPSRYPFHKPTCHYNLSYELHSELFTNRRIRFLRHTNSYFNKVPSGGAGPHPFVFPHEGCSGDDLFG